MIRIVMSFTKLVLGVVAALFVSSCHFTGTSGNGNVTTASRDVAEFTSVAVDRGLDVVIQQSDSRSVTVEADSNLHDKITTVVENGVLKISSTDNIFDAEKMKVIVKMPVIKGLETSGGASLTSANTLRSNSLHIESSSGSEIKVQVESDKVIAEASSGSQITISGKALSLETSSASGSELDAKELMANEVIAQANSGSSTDVHPIVSLDAQASSGSSVGYHGIPKKLNKQENSGGSVSQE